jgi:hypothetical protein
MSQRAAFAPGWHGRAVTGWNTGAKQCTMEA